MPNLSSYPKDRHASLRAIAMPSDANPDGDIFGGWVMSQMDIAGSSYSKYIAECRVVTVAVEAMTFHLPIFIGDEVSCYCETVKIGTSSISVHVEAWARRHDRINENIKVTEAVYTYVAMDENRKPRAIKR